MYQIRTKNEALWCFQITYIDTGNSELVVNSATNCIQAMGQEKITSIGAPVLSLAILRSALVALDNNRLGSGTFGSSHQ